MVLYKIRAESQNLWDYLVRWPVWSAKVAITKCHRLNGLNSRGGMQHEKAAKSSHDEPGRRRSLEPNTPAP